MKDFVLYLSVVCHKISLFSILLFGKVKAEVLWQLCIPYTLFFALILFFKVFITSYESDMLTLYAPNLHLVRNL